MFWVYLKAAVLIVRIFCVTVRLIVCLNFLHVYALGQLHKLIKPNA